nr:MAG TPA: hypothetical protein [Caudoviricetes sp.]
MIILYHGAPRKSSAFIKFFEKTRGKKGAKMS